MTEEVMNERTTRRNTITYAQGKWTSERIGYDEEEMEKLTTEYLELRETK